MALKKILLFVVVATVINAEYVSYENYKVYKVVPKSDNEVQILMDLQKQNEYMFWDDIISVNSDIKIMVSPEKQSELVKYFSDVRIPSEIVIQNVQEEINNQLRRPATRNTDYEWNYYLTLEEINEWIDQTAEKYPDIVTVVSIGTTNQGKTIRGLKIDYKKQDNPIIAMIEGGVHAREWISPATVTYIIDDFLTSTDEHVRFVAENIVWHIFPVINADGYDYTFTTDRMWRKNRNFNHNTTCGSNDDMSNGIDLNRNFDYLWNTVGASSDPCSNTYAGPSGFSEPESRAIRDYVTTIQRQGRMMYYIAFHSYSQMALIPYSHVGGVDVLEADNYADMYEIAIRGMDKLRALYNTSYRVGTSKDILYEVSGSSFDWVKGVAEVPIVFLFELRDLGEFGFLLPAAQIIPNSQEIMAGLIEMERVTRSLGYYQIEIEEEDGSRDSGEKVICSLFLLVLGLMINV